MQQVITAAEARKNTKGRTPLVPVEYEEACRALEACRTLDEAKYWNNKADALAAWAKIYRNDDAGRKAKALKLWAYRRMGEIAGELRPPRVKGKGHGRGQLPGAVQLLRENGLTPSSATAARRLANATEEQVLALTSLPRPPSPIYIAKGGGRWLPRSKRPSPPNLYGNHPSWTEAWACITKASVILAFDPVALSKSVAPGWAEMVREKIVKLQEWLDAFEQALPKEKKGK